MEKGDSVRKVGPYLENLTLVEKVGLSSKSGTLFRKVTHHYGRSELILASSVLSAEEILASTLSNEFNILNKRLRSRLVLS